MAVRRRTPAKLETQRMFVHGMDWRTKSQDMHNQNAPNWMIRIVLYLYNLLEFTRNYCPDASHPFWSYQDSERQLGRIILSTTVNDVTSLHPYTVRHTVAKTH